MNIKLVRIVACGGLWLFGGAALAAPSVPAALNYQGRLQNDQGPIAAGNYGIQFRCWSAPTGGTQLWARQFFPVYVASNGVFNVTLTDAGTELLTLPNVSDLLSAFAAAPLYLGITVVQTPSGPVSLPQQITPVRQFLSVPYSLTAHWSEDAHNLLNADHLLAQASGSWPPDSVYAVVLSPGAQYTASPLVGLFEVQAGGLWASAPVTFTGVVQAPQLIASTLGLGASYGTIAFGGAVRMLPLAAQDVWSLPYVDGNTSVDTLRLVASQDGLYVVTLPAFDNGTKQPQAVSVSVGNQSAMQLSGYTSQGVQRTRYFPIQSGQSITITVQQGPYGSGDVNVHIQFLPFGAAGL